MKLLNRKGIHFVTGSQKHFISNIILFDGAKSAQVFSIDIFLLSLFNCFKNLIERDYFFIVFFEIWFYNSFALALTTHKGKYLINYIRLSILFGIICHIFINIKIFITTFLLVFQLALLFEFFLFKQLGMSHFMICRMVNGSWVSTWRIIFLAR